VSEPKKVELPAHASQTQHQKPPEQELLQTKPLRTPPRTPPRTTAGAISWERADVLKRVAMFKAHQDKISQDREKYYEAVQEEIRRALGNQFKAKPL
jgi:hypothetical protein